MNDLQLGLDFDSVRARRADPETSHQAAARVPDFSGEHYVAILAALATGPKTIYEIPGLTHVQAARRMPELEDHAKVKVRAGEVRPSPSGRNCRVWELV